MKRERIETLEVFCGLQEKHTEAGTITLPVYVATEMHLAQKRAITDEKGTHENGYVHKMTVQNATVTKINESLMILYRGDITLTEVTQVGIFEDSIVRLDRTVL